MCPKITNNDSLIGGWKAESIRLTTFYNPKKKVDPSSWWLDILGCEPDTEVSRKKEGFHREEGDFENGKLILAVQPFRIDWSYIVAPDKENLKEDIPTLGSFTDELTKFSLLINKWLELKTCPAVQRMAFGAVLLQPVQSLQNGYEQLADYLKQYVKLDVKESSDFLYSINRPRTSGSNVKDLMINRLSKWTVVRLKRFEFSIPLTPSELFEEPEQFACRLEMDINTSADFTEEFFPEKLPVIYQELINFGKEIAIKGDIP